MKTDAELIQAVIDQLHWEPSLDAVTLGVAIKDDVVTLSGYLNQDQRSTKNRVRKIRGLPIGILCQLKAPGDELT
jgi:hypothetical protein